MGIATLLKLKGGDGFALFGACLFGVLVARAIHNPEWAIQGYILVSYHLFFGYLMATRRKENQHPIPIAGGVAVHLGFVALVVGLGYAHHYIPYFRLIRYAVAGLAVFERWFLFGAEPERHGQASSNGMLPAQSSFGSLHPQAVTFSSGSPSIMNATGPIAQNVPALSQSTTGLSFFQDAVNAPQIKSAPTLAQASPVAASSDTAKSRKKPVSDTPYVSPIVTATAEDHEAWLRYLSTQNPTHRKRAETLGDEYEAWLLARTKARAEIAAAAAAQRAAGAQ